MNNVEINSTAKELLSVRSMIAELEAEAESLTDKIKQAMTERGEEVLQSWVITSLTYISAGTGAGLSFHSAFDYAHSVPIRFLFLIAWE